MFIKIKETRLLHHWIQARLVLEMACFNRNHSWVFETYFNWFQTHIFLCYISVHAMKPVRKTRLALVPVSNWGSRHFHLRSTICSLNWGCLIESQLESIWSQSAVGGNEQVFCTLLIAWRGICLCKYEAIRWVRHGVHRFWNQSNKSFSRCKSYKLTSKETSIHNHAHKYIQVKCNKKENSYK